jgi:ATP-dependent DNA helicase RecG
MAIGETRYGRRKLFEVIVTDGSGLLKLKWFNYRLSYMKKRFKEGQRLFLYGNVSMFARQKEIIHPDIELMDENDDSMHMKGVVPIYSQIENLHQKTVRKLVRRIVEEYAGSAVGGVPEDIVNGAGLMGLKDAFREAHAPADSADSAHSGGPGSRGSQLRSTSSLHSSWAWRLKGVIPRKKAA